MALTALAVDERVDEPTLPDLEETVRRILGLHRHLGAYIPFGHRDSAGLKHKEAVTPKFLACAFPEFIASYLTDGALGLNGSYPAGVPRDRVSGQHPDRVSLFAGGKGRSFHCEKYIRNLNTCYVDLDCYEMTPAEALEEVGKLCDAGEIPTPTEYVQSGQGLWLHWHLHDEKNPALSHFGAQSDVICRYKDVNRALASKMPNLSPDLSAIDAARFTGVPGTLKTKSGKRVKWADYPGGRSYTLAELAQRMGVVTKRSPLENQVMGELDKPKRRGPVTAQTEARKRGWEKSKNNRMAAFTIIRELRGKFRKPTRGKALFISALVLRSARRSKDEALRLVAEVGAQHCHHGDDPIEPRECRERVESAYAKKQGGAFKYSYLTYQTMADWLDVTVEEADFVSRELQNTFPPASTRGTVIVSASLKERKAMRHEAIMEIVRAHGNVFSFTGLLDQLASEGIQSCKGTLSADLKELGIETPWTAGNHSRAKIQQPYLIALAS